MFDHTAEYHVHAVALQEDINQSVQEVITSVSSVLKRTNRETLTSIQEHYDAVDSIYSPALNDFNKIKDESCRKTSQNILDMIVELSGFQASSCVNKYDQLVKVAVNAANSAITALDDSYGQVQLIVTRSFIRQNAFLAPEDIKALITKVFEDVEAKWLAAKPQLEGIKNKLSTEIAASNLQLDSCHDDTQDTTSSMKPMFERSVNICLEYEQTESPFKSKSAGEPWANEMNQLYKEVKTYVENVDRSEW